MTTPPADGPVWRDRGAIIAKQQTRIAELVAERDAARAEANTLRAQVTALALRLDKGDSIDRGVAADLRALAASPAPAAGRPTDGEDTTSEAVLADVAAERAAQDAKWGQQNHPNGTGSVWEFCSGQHEGWAQEAADDARRRCQEAPQKPWGDTYALILNEEVAEAFAEEDPKRLREELIQVAAVAVAWVEAIDRRPASPAVAAEDTTPDTHTQDGE